jgi:hypothetical protein
MTSKKLGAILRSVPPATIQAEEPLSVSVPLPTALAPESLSQQQIAKPAGVEPEVPLQVLVPKHIRKQLAMKAAEEGQSLRALVLIAIRSLGITVSEEEIRDKRGRRST